jgi:DNA-binding response OmpR family regulator
MLSEKEYYYTGNYYNDVSSNNNTSSIRTSQKDNNQNYIEGKPPVARLLVIDDDPDILQLLKIGLQNNGFLVDAFTNPKEALQSFKSNAKEYCLVLSDFRMPEFSGIELAKEVRGINSDVKIVIITAFEIMDNVSLSLYVDGLVRKPIRIKKLTDKILNLLGDDKHQNIEGTLGQN